MGIDMRPETPGRDLRAPNPGVEESDEIESAPGIKALNIYGLSEIMGPGVAMECLEGATACISSKTISSWRRSIPPPCGTAARAREGELVFTTITKEAFPLVRFRTRDISRLMPEPCRCGRTLYRMDRVMGRSDTC